MRTWVSEINYLLLPSWDITEITLKRRKILIHSSRSSGGVVVKLLPCGAKGLVSILGLAATISEIGFLLLASRHMAEIFLK